jgi:hypothetical protein
LMKIYEREMKKCDGLNEMQVKDILDASESSHAYLLTGCTFLAPTHARFY